MDEEPFTGVVVSFVFRTKTIVEAISIYKLSLPNPYTEFHGNTLEAKNTTLKESDK